MKQYIGTKVVLARPMSRADYNDYRGWQLPADEDGADEGYLVEYVDGGKANVAGHSGYISWSPKDVFERAYKAQDTHVERMEAELAELRQRKCKLATFIHHNPIFLTLSAFEKGLLRTQEAAMLAYEEVLDTRIALAKQLALPLEA